MANARQRISLNGRWTYVPDQYGRGESLYFFLPPDKDRKAGKRDPVDHDVDGVDTIPVPACWNMAKPQLHFYERSLWYYRRFKMPPLKRGQRAFLCFEGSYYRTKAWLNGQLLSEPARPQAGSAGMDASHVMGGGKETGGHLGGFTPFEFEITDCAGKDNLLAVLADAARNPERCPTTVTDWFTYGGLYRDVFIEIRPARFVVDAFVQLDKRGDIVATVRTSAPGKARLAIPQLGIEQTIRADGRSKPATVSQPAEVFEGSVRIAAPARLKRWSPDNPKLYRVEVRFGADAWTDNVGFRTIAVRGGEFVLNGRPIRLKGICVHEDHITRGKSLTDADRRDVFREAKALGCNFLRLAHYPHSRRMAEMADRAGVLLWEEVPVYWQIQWQNPATYADAAGQLAELIVRDRNRASVILWSVANETPPDKPGRTEFLARLAKLARRLDPTRLTTAALFKAEKGGVLYCDDPLAAHLDVIGINQYAGWYGSGLSAADNMKRFNNVKYPGKPVIVSEFGADARAGARGRTKFTEDYQAKLYKLQLKGMSQGRGIRGVTPWILFDFRSPLRNNKFQQGFNRKGLVDADRRTRKLAFEVYRGFTLDGIR